jgi:hypothetical protein
MKSMKRSDLSSPANQNHHHQHKAKPSYANDNQQFNYFEFFTGLKDTYSIRIDDLQFVKSCLLTNVNIDPNTKSRLRILIESLLIDLNEEIFGIT